MYTGSFLVMSNPFGITAAQRLAFCPEGPHREPPLVLASIGRRKTGDSLKIEYPQNSLFRPAKWAQAPLGDGKHVVKSDLASQI